MPLAPTGGGTANSNGARPVNGELHRDHWTLPVQGATRADPDGVAQVIAHRDGAVTVYLVYGSFRAGMRLDVGRAAQLSTGIWEAAGAAAQQLSTQAGEDPAPPLSAPLDAPDPKDRALPRQATPPRQPTRQRRRTPPAHSGAANNTHTSTPPHQAAG